LTKFWDAILLAPMSGSAKPTEVLSPLSRRERQIMEIIYARGSATSREVHQTMANAASYSAVRAQMRVLVEKGVLRHQRVGLKYLFVPTVPTAQIRESALSRLVSSFFDNSPASVVAALLNSRELDISEEELRELKKLITDKQAAGRAKNV
jgi:BlaI family transcriptional regulator, penicillinase repressor